MTIEVQLYRIFCFESSYCSQALQCRICMCKYGRSGDAFNSFNISRCADVDISETIKQNSHDESRNDEV